MQLKTNDPASSGQRRHLSHLAMGRHDIKHDGKRQQPGLDRSWSQLDGVNLR